MTDLPNSRELSALEASIAVAWESRLKPKRESERDMIWKDAKTALEKIRAYMREQGK